MNNISKRTEQKLKVFYCPVCGTNSVIVYEDGYICNQCNMKFTVGRLIKLPHCGDESGSCCNKEILCGDCDGSIHFDPPF